MLSFSRSQLLRWTGLLCILLFFFPFFLQKTNLLSSDLGRHITNGRVILEEGSVFSHNRYSYTMPERHAPNHHWLFGVLAYWGVETIGFEGLTVVSALLYTAAIAFAIFAARHRSRTWSIGLAALFLAPLATMRFEVRPEAFSAVFFAIEIWLLSHWLHHDLSTKIVTAAFFVIAVLWVNIHIFFSLQALIIVCFAAALALKQHWTEVRSLLFFAGAVVLGSLINPLGLEGALYPAQIFGEYGYAVAENQSIWFLVSRFTNAHYIYVSFAAIILSVITGLRLWHIWKAHTSHTNTTQLAQLFLTATALVFTFKMIRFEHILAVTAIPILAPTLEHARHLFKRWQASLPYPEIATGFVSLVVCVIGIAMLGSGLWQPFRAFGTGLTPDNRASGQFFKEAGLQGPIFNNFDIGSYLIFELSETEAVFVDNRAEAYSNEHFERYRAAQLDEQAWQELDAEYTFNVIFFNRRENTEWAQEFLVRRVRDREHWLPVFVDNYSIIFVKNSPENQEVIEQYALPEEIFNIIDN